MTTLKLLKVQQTEFTKLLSCHLGFGVQIECLDLPVDKLEDGGDSKVHLKRIEHVDFHIENLSICVCFVRYVNKVSDLWGLYLFLLAGDQHAGHTHQL